MAEELEQPVEQLETQAEPRQEPQAEPQAEIQAETQAEPQPEPQPERNERFKWYILHAYSGFERKVRESIESRVEAFGLRTGWAG